MKSQNEAKSPGMGDPFLGDRHASTVTPAMWNGLMGALLTMCGYERAPDGSRIPLPLTDRSHEALRLRRSARGILAAFDRNEADRLELERTRS